MNGTLSMTDESQRKQFQGGGIGRLGVLLSIICFLAPTISLTIGVFSPLPHSLNLLMLLISPVGCVFAIWILLSRQSKDSKITRVAQAFIIGALIPFVVIILPWIMAFLISWFLRVGR